MVFSLHYFYHISILTLRRIVKQGKFPPHLRGRIWKCALRINKALYLYPGIYDQIIKQVQENAFQCDKSIETDARRVGSKEGKNELIANIQKAIVRYTKRDYHFSFMTFPLCLLLSHLSEEEAFWGLLEMIERYFEQSFYFIAEIKYKLFIHEQLFERYQPKLWEYFGEQGLPGSAYATLWLTGSFHYCPSELQERIYDGYLLEGPVFLQKISLAWLTLFAKEMLTMNFEEMVDVLRVTWPNAARRADKKLVRYAFELPGISKALEECNEIFHQSDIYRELQADLDAESSNQPACKSSRNVA